MVIGVVLVGRFLGVLTSVTIFPLLRKLFPINLVFIGFGVLAGLIFFLFSVK